MHRFISIASFVGSLSLLVLLSACNGMNSGQHQRAELELKQAQLPRTTGSMNFTTGHIEPVALFYGPMPTGVAVSKSGRLFVNFPRWGDKVDYTVAEVVNGQTVAFPNQQVQELNKQKDQDTIISVQSVVMDPSDRLWILDTGSIKMGPVKPGGPKLICVDLHTNQIVKKILFPDTVALKTSYLNDVRFDFHRGQEGMAFITDSSDKGPNGIIVVDIASGKSWRKLNDDPSTKADPLFIPSVEGQPLMQREQGKPPQPMKMGSDGIAIDPNKGLLYYSPLSSQKIHSVRLDALADPNLPDDKVAETIKQLPDRDFASDGLLCDSGGTLFLTDYEHNAIRKLRGDHYEIVAADPRMIWPDSMSINEGWLYFTANQLNRQARFHSGQDLRQKPYAVFRTAIAAGSAAVLRRNAEAGLANNEFSQGVVR